MRRWRRAAGTEPGLREKQRAWHWARKVRDARRAAAPYTNALGRPVCGLCGRGRPVALVERLRVSHTAPGGFARVLLPYCGCC